MLILNFLDVGVLHNSTSPLAFNHYADHHSQGNIKFSYSHRR